MIKNLILSECWPRPPYVHPPAAAQDAEHCLDPKTWLPGTLQVETASPASPETILPPRLERSPNHPDCALV